MKPKRQHLAKDTSEVFFSPASKKLIKEKENQEIKKDKFWVSKVLWDLRQHYLSIKK